MNNQQIREWLISELVGARLTGKKIMVKETYSPVRKYRPNDRRRIYTGGEFLFTTSEGMTYREDVYEIDLAEAIRLTEFMTTFVGRYNEQAGR